MRVRGEFLVYLMVAVEVLAMIPQLSKGNGRQHIVLIGPRDTGLMGENPVGAGEMGE